MLEQLKFELLVAAVGTATTRTVDFIRDKACGALKHVDVTCDTPMKKAAVTTAIGYALPYVPYLGRFQFTHMAAQQFRLHGMMQAGSSLLDRVFNKEDEPTQKEESKE